MSTRLVETHGHDIAFHHGDRPLFRYVYGAPVAVREAPRPFVHPLRTTAGDVVTVARPWDHVWHKGLSMTCAEMSGQNFWGGPTYVRDKGYVGLPNQGMQLHEGFDVVEHGAWRCRLVEQLRWLDHDSTPWIEETRRLAVVDAVPAKGYWVLAVDMALRNISGRTLEWGSPTTNGRENAGYGGLFWRGPRSFTGGTILAADGLEGEEIMGERSPWLAYVGRHDGVDRSSALVFVDHPENPRHPTQWFTRSSAFACASAAFMFDTVYEHSAEATLRLRYAVVVADGALSADEADRLARRYAEADAC